MLNYLPVNHQIEIESHYKFDRNYDSELKHNVEIKRYLADDSFSIKSSFKATKNERVRISLQINDKIVSEVEKFVSNYEYHETLFLAPQINLDLAKVQKISVLIFSLDQAIEPLNLIYASTYYLKLNDYKRDWKLSPEQGIKVKIPKIIKIASHAAKLLNGENDSKTVEYFEIIFKPVVFSRLNHIEKILELEFKSPEPLYLARDLDLKVGKIESNSLDKKTFLHGALSNQKLMQRVQNKFSLKISSDSYYDFAKKATIIGAHTNSKIGFLIPYFWKGDFNFKFPLKINHAFKDLAISTTQNFLKPLLDKNEGTIQLFFTEWAYDAQINWEIFYLQNNKFELVTDNNYSLRALNLLAQKNPFVYKDEEKEKQKNNEKEREKDDYENEKDLSLS